MSKFKISTHFNSEEKTKYHIINESSIECSGADCKICKMNEELSFEIWESSIPYPIPRKKKRYKNKLFHENRGKTIREICFTCREIPCYICRRKECKEWWKEGDRKGQQEGCSWWKDGKCINFVCEKGIIRKKWEGKI